MVKRTWTFSFDSAQAVIIATILYIFVTGCDATLGNSGISSPILVNSFCLSYERVIHNEADANALTLVNLTHIKQRIATNETRYRCECEHWDNPICVKR